MDVTVNKTRSQYQVLFCFQSRISVMSRFIRSRLCIDAYFPVADVEVADYSLRVLLGWPSHHEQNAQGLFLVWLCIEQQSK